MPFTVRQLLAVQPPPPPLYPDWDPFRPTGTHSSSSTNENYDYIHPAELESIALSDIASFRNCIDSMSPPFIFHSDLTVPFRGTRLMSEGDVTAYLETQGISAAWETILLLVPPTDRIYDLITMRQRNLGGCIPDQVFGVLTRSPEGKPHFTPCAVLEIKSPKIVQGMLSVFDALRAEKLVEVPADWVRTTRQLTKYAVVTGVKDLVIMDEGSAIYFRFPSDSQDSETITYLAVNPAAASNIDPSLSPREIIVFLGYRSLAAKGIELRNFSDPSTTGNPAPELDFNRRVQPKRNQPQAKTTTTGQFQGFQLHATVTLEFLPSSSPARNTHHRTASRDSGFHESLTQQRPFLQPLTGSTPRGLFLVKDLIMPNVAVLIPCNASHQHPVLAKIPHSPKRRDAEVDAYDTLSKLQGGPIPHFYGVYRAVVDGQATDQDVLLMEFIAPGTSIKSLGDAEEWERIIALRESAMSALDMIHRAGVVHHDAYARNFLVSESGEVVVVDFDLARRHADNLKRRKREQVADRSFLMEAFWVPESVRDGE